MIKAHDFNDHDFAVMRYRRYQQFARNLQRARARLLESGQEQRPRQLTAGEAQACATLRAAQRSQPKSIAAAQVKFG